MSAPFSSSTDAAKPRLSSAFKRLMSVHWWMASCYCLLFIGGTFMAQLSREVPVRGMLYDFHKSIGVLTMMLLTYRILVLLQVWWRKYTKRWPKLTLKWWRNFSLHTLMYLMMWAVPIAGFLLSNSFKPNNVKFFGILLPDLFPQSESMVDVGRNAHFWLAYTFLAAIVLHAIVQWKVLRSMVRRSIDFVKRQRKSNSI